MIFTLKKLAYSFCFFLLEFSIGGKVLAADSIVTVNVISEAGAKQAIEAAEQAAQKLHAPCAIAVVDRSGILVALLKMDGVRDGSPDLAIGKARTSALLQRPSAETETNVNEGRTAFVTSGFMTLRGGVPLMAGKEIVGAIGIAGLNKDTDVTIANAAAAAFATTTGTQPVSR
ncbi:heme-binding protein [Granulicella mallensis]|uniref:Glc operon protein GlcG n=1 Tax=Granulicella mallensis TaxID=940614 RepID=A0A7W7ZQT4_9BACT|nr:heme-binding protein [Granulicella mallensis]MBB5064431.1 glc operon protein GlcG [Granulicella mallensis]